MRRAGVIAVSGVSVALTVFTALLPSALARPTNRLSKAAPTSRAARASKPAPAAKGEPARTEPAAEAPSSSEADGALLAQGDRPLAPARESKSAVASPADTQSAEPSVASATNDVSPERAAPSHAVSVPDLTKLRSDYDRLREELFKARVRSQKVADVVYASKFDVSFRWKGGPDFLIRKARFLLDGAEIWDSTDKNQTDDRIDIASRSVKPGPHALTVSLEIRPKAEAKGGAKTGADKLGYTSEHVFAIAIPDSGQTHLLLTGDEDGDPPEYEPELELEVKTEK